MKIVTFRQMISCAAVVCTMSLFTSCDEVMSKMDNPVSSYLAVSESNVVVPTGDTYQIQATTINSDSPVTYKSSDETVATVDANGVVTGVADGEAVITVAVAASPYYQEGTKEVKVAVKRPLTFEALEDGQINVVYRNGITLDKPIVYSVNKGEQKKITATASIPVKKGDRVEFESANDHTGDFGFYGSEEFGYKTDQYVSLQPRMRCAVFGNVMSMITPDGNYHTNKTITKPYALQHLLYNSPAYTSAGVLYYTESHDKYDLLLPATKLTTKCYAQILCNAAITRAPKLPATELAPYCYTQLFYNCTKLEKAPELPATTAPSNCYNGMFFQCESLTEAPAVLPATTLEESCYMSMFYGCKSLTEGPALPATTLANSCYSGMFAGCYALKKAPDLPATKLASNCYQSMFGVCRSLTEAPELKAETLPSGCYSSMFHNCTKLSKVTCLAKEMAGNVNPLYRWLYNTGTDASVTTRTFIRNTANNSWKDSNESSYFTLQWHVPANWTITPTIE